jgi:hypothetical protein
MMYTKVCRMFLQSYFKFQYTFLLLSIFFNFNWYSGVQLGPLGTTATNGLLCQLRVIMMMEKLVE